MSSMPPAQTWSYFTQAARGTDGERENTDCSHTYLFLQSSPSYVRTSREAPLQTSDSAVWEMQCSGMRVAIGVPMAGGMRCYQGARILFSSLGDGGGGQAASMDGGSHSTGDQESAMLTCVPICKKNNKQE